VQRSRPNPYGHAHRENLAAFREGYSKYTLHDHCGRRRSSICGGLFLVKRLETDHVMTVQPANFTPQS
jgi:hypothetical protein